jgi:hypothetical protein
LIAILIETCMGCIVRIRENVPSPLTARQTPAMSGGQFPGEGVL